jgi:hypothetical protein
MVDAADLKSVSRKGVWVRVPPSAPAVVEHFASPKWLTLVTSDYSSPLPFMLF